MPRLSLEIVPHSQEKIYSEIDLMEKKYTHFDTINIPNIKKLSISCLEAVKIVQQYTNLQIIPHITAGDYTKDISEITQFLQETQIKEVLIIQGDKKKKV